MNIELIAFPECPHLEIARERLATALRDHGLEPRWIEWNSALADAPERVRGCASPTILIDGVDIVAGAPTSGAGCAIAGAPSIAQIRMAIEAASIGGGP